MDIVTENDPNSERSTKLRSDVYDMISCYKEMLWERKLQAMELTLYTLLKKKADNSSGNEPYPGPSDSTYGQPLCTIHIL
jgi:hypothetical protein